MSFAARRSDGSGETLIVTFHAEGRGADQFHDAARAFLPDAYVVSPEWEGENSARLAAFVEGEIERTAATRVTGIGHSRGADTLAAVAAAAPTLFHAIALLHPTAIPAEKPVPGLAMTRVLVTGGRADPQSPPEITEAIADWFGAQKADVTLAWHPGAGEIPQSEVDALGHFVV